MRNLDFIIFGSARSGTTALSRLMQASRELFCGIEYFEPHEDHSHLEAPHAFFAKEADFQNKNRPLQPNHIETLNALRAADQTKIRAYGNKYPIYYKRIAGIFQELGHEKSILTFRPFKSVLESYNMLSSDSSPWPEGRTALYAAAEAMMLMRSLETISGEETLVVPQKLLSRDWRSVMDRISEHLVPGLTLSFDLEAVAQIESAKQRRNRAIRPALSAPQMTALSMLEDTGINEILDAREPFLLGERMDDVKKAVKRLPNDPDEYLSTLLSRPEAKAEVAFHDRWKKIVA